eukprot:COSAG01_NODE_4227_length_5224_cov_4.060683_6_plen_513_part_01
MLDVVDVIECKLASAGDRKLQSQAQPPTVFASQHSEQGVPVYSRKAGSNTKWMWHASLRSAQHAIGVCHHHIKQCCDGQRQSATRIADKDGSQFQFRFDADIESVNKRQELARARILGSHSKIAPVQPGSQHLQQIRGGQEEQSVPVYSRKVGSSTKWVWHASQAAAVRATNVSMHFIKQCCNGQRPSGIADRNGSHFHFRFDVHKDPVETQNVTAQQRKDFWVSQLLGLIRTDQHVGAQNLQRQVGVIYDQIITQAQDGASIVSTLQQVNEQNTPRTSRSMSQLPSTRVASELSAGLRSTTRQSQYRGVFWNETRRVWEARLRKEAASIATVKCARSDELIQRFGCDSTSEYAAAQCYARYAPACEMDGRHPTPQIGSKVGEVKSDQRFPSQAESTYRGVSWDTTKMKWKAKWQPHANARSRFVGYFDTEQLADQAIRLSQQRRQPLQPHTTLTPQQQRRATFTKTNTSTAWRAVNRTCRTAMCQRVVETLLYRRKSQGYSSSDLAAAIPGF